MSLTDNQLHRLLYRSEGVDLDFKQAQYRFIGADEMQKSELLKDILAIANSWRTDTGYILIGFKDRGAEPAEVVGIDSNDQRIDDAQLQQFVHGKVTPKLIFKYEERFFEGKRVGIISIPVQRRPFYITTKYGRVMSNIVYLRRGSSTAEASPPEVMQMNDVESEDALPQVTVSILDEHNGEHPLAARLAFLQHRTLRDYEAPPQTFGGIPILGTFNNPDFYRELGAYAKMHVGSIKLKIKIGNHSNFPLKDCKFEFRVRTPDVQHVIIPDSGYPVVPSRTSSLAGNLSTMPPIFDKRAIRLLKKGTDTIGYARTDTILSGDEFITEDFMIQLFQPCNFDLEIRVLAEQLSPPFVKTIQFAIEGEQVVVDENLLIRDYLPNEESDS